jgi:hypothetical protein
VNSDFPIFVDLRCASPSAICNFGEGKALYRQTINQKDGLPMMPNLDLPAPQITISGSSTYVTIADIKDLYEQRHNEKINYHTIYMATLRRRIPSTLLSGRIMIRGKDVPAALEILRGRRRHRARKA